MSQNIKEDLELFQVLVGELLEKEITDPVVKPINPGELYNKLDLELTDEPALEDQFKKSLRELILHTPKTASNRFFNQLFGGRNGKAILGDLLSVMLNSSMYTYKVAGPQVGVEREIVKKVCSIVGYGEGSGGTIPTGGSMSNFVAMLCARDRYNPNIKQEGMDPMMVAYTSEVSHYSLIKTASFIGMGTDKLRNVPADSRGRMRPDALEEMIQNDLENGFKPFFVNATVGTTVMGAFDSLTDLSVICDKYDLWLHGDGAFSGSAIFSNTHKNKVKGSELTDSYSFNAHKLLNTPLTCSVIAVRNRQDLIYSFDHKADYLYQTENISFNPGRTSFQCGRRNDALKFWTLWKSIGSKGLGSIIDKQFELAAVARKYVKDHPEYTLYNDFEALSICFNYKNYDPKSICTLLNEEQQAMVGFGTFRGETFIRLVSVNPNNEEKDILKFFEILEEFTDNNAQLISTIEKEVV